MDVLLVGGGLALLIAALVGGGIKAAGFEIPLIPTLGLRLVVGVFGLLLIAISQHDRLRGFGTAMQSPPAAPTAAAGMLSTSAAPTAAAGVLSTNAAPTPTAGVLSNDAAPAALLASPAIGGGTRPWCRSNRLNPTERTICADARLSALDASLEAVYGNQKAATDDDAQLAWLKSERDACGIDSACIARAYTRRMDELLK